MPKWYAVNVQHKPLARHSNLYVYGELEDGQINNVRAMVRRTPDNYWEWECIDSGKEGVAHKREDAMQEAEQHV